MAHFGKDLDDFKGSRCIHLRSAEQTEHFTLYTITVTVGSYTWTVKHRYSDFYQLHEKLATSYKLDRSLLPPKKMFGNQTESFIKKRQRELEIYLQTVVLFLVQHIPSCMAYFLDFDKYEIHGITQAMAEDLYGRGELLLLSRDKYEVSTLQLYALTERLKLPEPTCDSGDIKKDLGHILDFITRAKHLKVVCSKKPVGTSNIMMGKLPFDLTLFKSLQTLEIWGCNFRLVNGLEVVKQTVVKFDVHESSSSMKEIILQDAPHWRAEDGAIVVGFWSLVTEVDFSHNSFVEIHDSIQLMPNIEKFNLSHNTIASIANLHWLSHLTHLNLSHNNVHHVDSLHTKLGNIKCLSLAHNKLESLHGFAKLFSLEMLDVSYNRIVSIEELRHVSQLPCLEDLSLVGSPVTSALDYRTKTFEMFGDRVSEVVLDKKPADQVELDTVAVLLALKKAKDVKMSRRAHPKKNASAVSLSDMYSQSYSSSVSDYQDERSSMAASPTSHDLRVPVLSSLADWHRRDRTGNNQSPCSFSQESVSSYNSCVERDGQAEGNNNNSGMERDGQAEGNNIIIPATSTGRSASSLLPSDGIDPEYMNTNNSSSFTNNTESNRFDIMKGFLNEAVPEAHPFDLEIESSSPYPPHQLATSFTARNSRTGTLTFSTADLPTTSNPAFLLWLNKHLYTSGDTSSASDTASSKAEREFIIDILWCYMEQLSKPSKLQPCCAILTKRHFFIEKLSGSESSFPGVPELKSCSMISIQNIQQLVLGPCHAFLRLEEAFVGKSGVFTFFGTEPHSLKQFFNKLFNACCGFEIINSYSFVDLTVKSDLLQTITSREERHSEVSSDRLVSATLVQLKNSDTFNFLVLSENKVYCVDLDCTHWPPASFETSHEASIRFNVLHEFSIMDKISNIKISPTEEHAFSGGKSPFKVGSSGKDIEFVQFELSLDVTFSNISMELSEGIPEASQRHFASVGYCFPSAACRDLFLDRLSNMRTELAHRMSPSVREEPEGGNEQLSSGDSHRYKSWPISSSKPMPSPYFSGSPSFAAQQASPKGGFSFTKEQSSPKRGPLFTKGQSSPKGGFSFTTGHSSPKGAPSFASKQTILKGGSSSTKGQTSPRDGFSLTTEQASPKRGSAFTIGQTSPKRGAAFTIEQTSPKRGAAFTIGLASSVDDSSVTASQTTPAEGLAFISGPTASTVKPLYKDTANEAQDLAKPSAVTHSSQNSRSQPRFDDHFDLSKSVLSSKSTAAISVGKSDSGRQSPHQTMSSSYSSSPRDDLSISPMSNFSRASISPPPGPEPESRSRKHPAQPTTITRMMVPAKADSLPSSFEWKQFYFKSLPAQSTTSGHVSSTSNPVPTVNSNTRAQYEPHNPSFNYLEDIDSSSEFETGVSVETEHELYLKHCIKSYDLLHPLSAKLKPLCLMNGRELITFFRSIISQKLYADNQDMLSEELHYVLWTTVVPYTNPKHEIATLVMLSTHGIYLVSDTSPKMAHKSRPSWMSHSRNRSDSAITVKPGNSTDGRKLVEPYFIFRYKDLQQVNIGLFDQCVRLTGSNEHSVFTIATRDSIVTETLVQKLKHVLSFVATSPVREKSRTETETDFYKPSLQNVKLTLDGIVYTHPSKVKFVYPGEDAVRDILYLVNEYSSYGKKALTSTESNSKLWLYLQCYLLPSDDERAPNRSQAISAVTTATHFCLAEEDVVTYPLPDFVRGVPENPCHEIIECRRIDSLKRITLFHGYPHTVSLTFLDEPQDIVVDVSMQHFGQIKERQQLSPEITYRLFVQSMKERDKLVQVLDTLWKGLVTQVGRILDINKM